MSYKKYCVQGFLKKMVQEVKFFQTSFTHKRYFVLDHYMQRMRIHKTNEAQSDYKIVHYRDILDVRMEREADSKKNMTIQQRWSFRFTVITKDRAYILQSSSFDERNLWFHTFCWIIAQQNAQKYK